MSSLDDLATARVHGVGSEATQSGGSLYHQTIWIKHFLQIFEYSGEFEHLANEKCGHAQARLVVSRTSRSLLALLQPFA